MTGRPSNLGLVDVLIPCRTRSVRPALDADYGAVLSLYERLAASAAQAGRDLFFVQNGDLNDGTGLSRVPPATLLPLIQKMPFDALTTVRRGLP